MEPSRGRGNPADGIVSPTEVTLLLRDTSCSTREHTDVPVYTVYTCHVNTGNSRLFHPSFLSFFLSLPSRILFLTVTLSFFLRFSLLLWRVDCKLLSIYDKFNDTEITQSGYNIEKYIKYSKYGARCNLDCNKRNEFLFQFYLFNCVHEDINLHKDLQCTDKYTYLVGSTKIFDLHERSKPTRSPGVRASLAWVKPDWQKRSIN